MDNFTLPDQLDDAAESISSLSRAQLAVLLHRAAIRLRNQDGITFDDETENALLYMASVTDLPRKDMIRRIVRESLEVIADLPGVRRMAEDDVTKESA